MTQLSTVQLRAGPYLAVHGNVVLIPFIGSHSNIFKYIYRKSLLQDAWLLDGIFWIAEVQLLALGSQNF